MVGIYELDDFSLFFTIDATLAAVINRDMISTKERKLLLGFASIVLLLFVVEFAVEIYQYASTPKPVPGGINFAAHGYRNNLAGLHLMTPIVFVSLIFARKFIVSTILTGVYGLVLTTSYFVRLNGEGAYGGEGFYDGKKLLEFYIKSHEFDFVACLFIFIVLIWQISILIRQSGKLSRFD